MEIIFEIAVWILNLELIVGYYLRIRLLKWFFINQIPQLLIQPLVENAIKHGLSQITENGLIGILVCKEENQLKIRVYDNGPAFPDGPLSGFGIQNTQERIAVLYGAKASINWQNGAEKYMEILIPV